VGIHRSNEGLLGEFFLVRADQISTILQHLKHRFVDMVDVSHWIRLHRALIIHFLSLFFYDKTKATLQQQSSLEIPFYTRSSLSSCVWFEMKSFLLVFSSFTRLLSEVGVMLKLVFRIEKNFNPNNKEPISKTTKFFSHGNNARMPRLGSEEQGKKNKIKQYIYIPSYMTRR